MQKILNKLYEVQKLDLKLDEIVDLRGDLPEQIATQRAELKDIESKYNRFLEKEKEVQTELNKVQNNIITINEELKRDEAHLYDVKSNKEYDALTKQIKNHQEQLVTNEQSQGDLKSKLDKITRYVIEYKENVENLKSTLENNEEDLTNKINQTEKDEVQLSKEKKKIEDSIDKQFLRAYINIRRAKKVAVATMIRNACSGCNSVMPLQKQAEIRDGKKLISCEVCGRIIIFIEEEAAEQIN